ncbi:ATP cone domain-containing protein [Clostridium sp. MB05]|jgi:transcriptional repressor NrdR|uniref:ATP cone domain-containing protein n=1 Tax=Clostridium sp. MB05 TaxID=3376682 RepID=UPI0039826DE6
MKIIKKDGRLEEFNVKKIKTSIENAARDSGTMLNESDLKILVNDAEKTLLKTRKDSLITSSYEVIGVIFDILKRDGFNSILRSYLEFDK